jgi:hypothetical protein
VIEFCVQIVKGAMIVDNQVGSLAALVVAELCRHDLFDELRRAVISRDRALDLLVSTGFY